MGTSLPILVWPDERLRLPCQDVLEFDDRLGQLVDDMITTMTNCNGIGLAAPQVNVQKNILVVWLPSMVVNEPKDTSPPRFTSEYQIKTLINPTILEIDDTKLYSCEEGCLSVPGYFDLRKRPYKVTVEYQDVAGQKHKETFEWLHAFVVQHEMDHLNGKLFIDDLSKLKKDWVRKKIRKFRRSI